MLVHPNFLFVIFQAHNNLISLLDQADINIVKSVAFVNDPESAVKELKVMYRTWPNT